MGAPITLSKTSQTGIGVGHISAMIDVLKNFKFEEMRGTVRLIQEAVGVCALITPWNWPMNQVAAKVVPALAAGCTMVLKPSEYSPFSAIIWAKVMHEAGVPAGVFNLINGDGNGVGAPLSSHREVDMVSFTGSTRAGSEVARNAAASVKRVHQELGGKSPNVLLDDADFERAVTKSVLHVFQNSGQLRRGRHARVRRRLIHGQPEFHFAGDAHYSTTLGTRKKLSSLAGAFLTMSAAMPPSVTASARLFIAIGVTEVIGATPATSTSCNCSTKASMALSSPRANARLPPP